MNLTSAAVTGLMLVGLLGTAEAHFKLNAPTSVTVQSNIGDPQKSAPCGGAGTASSAVTAVQSGQMLSISLDETVFHPGHYRVAVAQTEAGLPADPTVANAQCNGLNPVANPTLPVLADGLLAHTAAFSGTQTMKVMIPAGMTCTGCVLQVLEYMSSHAQPCFYHHCATVNISPNAPPPPDAGIPGGGDAGVDPTDPGTGCCSASPHSAATGLLGGLAVGLLLRRRRRR
jgi:MYXO-CTERM domain-containing protein